MQLINNKKSTGRASTPEKEKERIRKIKETAKLRGLMGRCKKRKRKRNKTDGIKATGVIAPGN